MCIRLYPLRHYGRRSWSTTHRHDCDVIIASQILIAERSFEKQDHNMRFSCERNISEMFVRLLYKKIKYVKCTDSEEEPAILQINLVPLVKYSCL